MIVKAPISYCEKENKVKYDKRGAETARNLRWREDRVELRIYPCPHCKHWHLTAKL